MRPYPVRLRGNKKSGDPDEIRTRETAVKGRCLNRLTTGPELCRHKRLAGLSYSLCEAFIIIIQPVRFCQGPFQESFDFF